MVNRNRPWLECVRHVTQADINKFKCILRSILSKTRSFALFLFHYNRSRSRSLQLLLSCCWWWCPDNSCPPITCSSSRSVPFIALPPPSLTFSFIIDPMPPHPASRLYSLYATGAPLKRCQDVVGERLTAHIIGSLSARVSTHLSILTKLSVCVLFFDPAFRFQTANREPSSPPRNYSCSLRALVSVIVVPSQTRAIPRKCFRGDCTKLHRTNITRTCG